MDGLSVAVTAKQIAIPQAHHRGPVPCSIGQTPSNENTIVKTIPNDRFDDPSTWCDRCISSCAIIFFSVVEPMLWKRGGEIGGLFALLKVVAVLRVTE